MLSSRLGYLKTLDAVCFFLKQAQTIRTSRPCPMNLNRHGVSPET